MFSNGDKIRRRATGEIGFVLDVGPGDLLSVAFGSDRVQIHSDELELVVDNPAELLARASVDEINADRKDYVLRLRAAYLRHAYKYDAMSGLSNARIEPALHQVYVAHRVTNKLQPRMILADEVGLGKTIEAGLILKELRARGLVDRVLVVCPASLQLQWQQELKTKFNEDFEIIDGLTEKYLTKGTRKNAFAQKQNVICSLPFASTEKRSVAIVEAGWDLVIFDEAHRVRRKMQGKKVTETKAYKLADELKEITEGLLLLSATPMQIHQFELFSLIELAEPGLFSNYEAYETSRTTMPRLNLAMRSLATWDAGMPEEHQATVEQLKPLLAGTGASISANVLSDPDVRAAMMDELELLHPLASVLVRNRKSVLEASGAASFARREAIRYLVELTPPELELYNDITEYIRTTWGIADESKNTAVGLVMAGYQRMLTSSAFALRQSMKGRVRRLGERLERRRSGQETEAAKGQRKSGITADRLQDLIDAEEYSTALEELEGEALEEAYIEWEIEKMKDFIDRLAEIKDSKAKTLVEMIDTLCVDHPDEKILIFTQFKQTQAFLCTILEHNGYKAAIFNGDLKLEEKEAAVREFRGPKQILISTEAGGEGRNFQFAHLMVNYDLPWNPMKVEQRIGRLDRIGQKKPVMIYNLACKDTLEERVLEVLERRIRVFEESVGSLDPILGELEKDIAEIALKHSEHLDEEFDRFDRKIEVAVAEARTKEALLQDFVLDRASMRQDEAVELLGEAPLARAADLAEFASDLLDRWGGYVVEHVHGGFQITLSDQLRSELRAQVSGLHGIFDPREALQNEEVEFLAMGHWFVEGILSLATDTEARIGVRSDSGVEAPTVEVIYELESVGVRPSGRMIRHLVGEDLVVLSEDVCCPPQSGRGARLRSQVDWVSDAVEASAGRIAEQHAAEREVVRAQNEELKRAYREREVRLLEYRRDRLRRVIRDDLEWVEKAEKSGSERDLKILPARRGKLQKNRDRLSAVESESKRRIEEIEAREASVAIRVIGAGIVVPE